MVNTIELKVARIRKNLHIFEVADELSRWGFRMSATKYGRIERGIVIPIPPEKRAICKLLEIDAVESIWPDKVTLTLPQESSIDAR